MDGQKGKVAYAIVLAGGTGRRMGRVSKPDVIVGGRRMIDHVLDELADQSVPAVVVGPPDLDVGADAPVRPGASAYPGASASSPTDHVAHTVTLVREDPPLGGPAAGIAAGYAAGLDFLVAADQAACLVAILACDAPFAPRALPRLTAAASIPAKSVGAVAITPDGRLQRLLCVVDADSLGAAIERLESNGGVRDRSVRALLGDLPLTPVDVPAWAMDADTLEDVLTLESMSPIAPKTSP